MLRENLKASSIPTQTSILFSLDVEWRVITSSFHRILEKNLFFFVPSDHTKCAGTVRDVPCSVDLFITSEKPTKVF